LSGSAGHSSSASRRVRTRRYYKTASSSHVDESLFGFQKPTASAGNGLATNLEREADERTTRRRSASAGAPVTQKNTVQVITKDLIRNLM
jgi:hypothetical protein